jgi:hypothetical protein
MMLLLLLLLMMMMMTLDGGDDTLFECKNLNEILCSNIIHSLGKLHPRKPDVMTTSILYYFNLVQIVWFCY